VPSVLPTATTQGVTKSHPSTTRPISISQPTFGKDSRLAGADLNLVLDENFDGPLNTNNWNQEVTLWGGGVSGCADSVCVGV